MKHTEQHEVLTKLKAFIAEQNNKDAQILLDLVDHYFVAISRKELSEQPLTELYAKFYSHFKFMHCRQDGQIKLRVFNPDKERDGFVSPHTIIELNQQDMPFLVDSMLMELKRRDINVHFILHNGAVPVIRNERGEITAIPDKPNLQSKMEANIYIEVDYHNTSTELMSLQDGLFAILSDVGLAVADFQRMREKMQLLAKQLPDEKQAFLNWLRDNHFTFLGYIAYGKKGNKPAREPETALGLMQDQSTYGVAGFDEDFPIFPKEVDNNVLLVCKSGLESTVHRAAYMDAILIREFDSNGEIEREHRFIGLYTSRAYHLPARDIPLLHEKVEYVYKRANFAHGSHDIKALEDVIESFPKDELFQMSKNELYETAMEVIYIQERQKLKLFVRRDVFGRFFSVMVYLPREHYNTKLRKKLQKILLEELDGNTASFTPHFLPSSILCRVDFTIRVAESARKHIDIAAIEEKLKYAARNWQDDLCSLAISSNTEKNSGRICTIYSQAFPGNYQEDFTVLEALRDISSIEKLLHTQSDLLIEFEQDEKKRDTVHLKMMQCHRGLWLAHVLPILENFGLKVIEERPYEIKLPDDLSIWISDFVIEGTEFIDRFSEVQTSLKEALLQVWNKEVENDGFNRLTLLLALPARKVVLLRAIGKYLVQIGFTYSQKYFEDTLSSYPELTRILVELFFLRFDPANQHRKDRHKEEEALYARFEEGLKAVKGLDQDRILRKYRDVLKAMLRTNYFQKDKDGHVKSCVSFKLDPGMIPNLPKPVPLAEIFVYAPEVEGVHLRGARVARGGIRWSDRPEDFRTEVLGLMKAQQVKNAVIVPLGAKGGFYPKNLPVSEGREAVQNEAIRCYKIYISAMLDITDNIVENKIIPPVDVMRYDEDDPYFVVAADKGTATFSDIANGIALEYGFWLGDAFASGGSNGYDHKKMGITARGAWESVKRHFLFLNKDIQREDFTVIGIGDMSGDVFGNGMLLSKHIRLVAAFNHMHIFLDPNPDVGKSFAERKRLFHLPRSTWKDYHADCISQGGGVYERSLKTIPISPEVKAMLGIEADELEPNNLIQAILKAPVELLWNGGIGTYVKASTQNNIDVGDRANDPLRVDANQLRCKVVGEGGNLGFTQLARIEYALAGGQICTDAIDNSAGVDCSDHEVNIKILLNPIMQQGKLTLEARNQLLSEMENEVSALVLSDNYHQTQTISNGVYQSTAATTYIRLLRELEREGFINRELEALPSDKTLKSRIPQGQSFTKPEFSVLMAYTKNTIKKLLLTSNLPEEPYFMKYLRAEFPKILSERFLPEIENHHLKREIILTQLTNTMIQYMGIAYTHRMYDEVGASPAMSTRAFAIALEIFNVEAIWAEIEALDGKVPAQVQIEMMNEITNFLLHQCRWLLRHYRTELSVEGTIEIFKQDCSEILKLSPHYLNKDQLETRKNLVENYVSRGAPKHIAEKVTDFYHIYSALDMINAAHNYNIELPVMMHMYYTLSQVLGLSWLRQRLNEAAREGYWTMLTASSFKDDLNLYQASLVVNILQNTNQEYSLTKRIQEWSKNYDYFVRRWHILLDDFKATLPEFVRMASLLNGLKDLVELCESTAPDARKDH